MARQDDFMYFIYAQASVGIRSVLSDQHIDQSKIGLPKLMSRILQIVSHRNCAVNIQWNTANHVQATFVPGLARCGLLPMNVLKTGLRVMYFVVN